VDLGRVLIVAGLCLLAAGIYIRLGLPVPPLGRLPGDIVIERGNAVIYIPITTMVLLSVLLTLVLQVVARLR
jgi:hypothetical protein